MKKILLFAAMMLAVVSTWARPALRGAVKCMQPDGTAVMLELHGDEYYHFSTTADGYTVLKSAQGVYEYARLDGQRLVSTGVQARDAGQRSASEVALLAGLGKHLTDREAIERSKVNRSARDRANQSPARAFDQSKFRGLIILINFKDQKFSRSDIVDLYSRMTSERNYSGYKNEDGSTNYYGQLFRGSVRDYFYDQSGGQFDPEFDVFGPYESNYNASQCNSNSRTIFQAALRALNTQIDYSLYDGDSNGVVDNVCFVVAGWGSHVQGNNSGFLWPHESRYLLTSSKLDGKTFDIYSCSTEMLSSEGTELLEGVGTFCHEFGHVLGLPDFYDTDYADQGQSHDPGEWDIMAGGADHNYGRCPAGHSIFERYALGWAKPPVLTAGSYELNPLNTSNEGFMMLSPVNKQYFMFENRQKTGWDSFLPGHGMLAYRVDSTWISVWTQNKVNANPDHNYYVLLRAGNTNSGSSGSDPFPGTAGVMMISNFTSPSLKTWSNKDNSLMINKIRENSGVITFDVLPADDFQALVEDFEQMEATTETGLKGVEGNFTTWNFTRCNVTTPGADLCNGTNAVAMVQSTALTSVEPIYYNINQAYFSVANSTNVIGKFTLTYSVDDGATWTNARTISGSTAVSIPANSKSGAHWVLDLANNQPARFRITMSSGNKNNPCYVDDFMLFYDGEQGGPDIPQGVVGDITGDNIVDVADINAVINIMLGTAPKIDAADVTGDGNVDIADVNMIVNIMLQ